MEFSVLNGSSTSVSIWQFNANIRFGFCKWKFVCLMSDKYSGKRLKKTKGWKISCLCESFGKCMWRERDIVYNFEKNH